MARVAIVGAHATPVVATRDDVSVQDLVFEGARGALGDAGIARADLDAVVLCAHDLVDGRGIANMASAGAAGAYMKSETRTPNDGVFALILGTVSVLAGRADLVLVIGWGKSSEGFDDGATATEFEPFGQRPTGLTESRALALQASRLLRRDGPAARRAASAAIARDRRQGGRNEWAHLREPVEPDQVAGSRVVSWPLTELDLPPRSDGACAVVLASERRAAALGGDPVWVDGTAWSTDVHSIGARDLTRSPSLRRAAAGACRAAGLASVRDADVVEYAARSSFQHIVAVEELGLCAKGAGASYLLGEAGGGPVLNPSGGLACSNLLPTNGLLSTVSAVDRLRASPASSGATAIVHGTVGPCAQSNAVAVLSTGGEERRNGS